jgi:hypothetical protein
MKIEDTLKKKRPRGERQKKKGESYTWLSERSSALYGSRASCQHQSVVILTLAL